MPKQFGLTPEQIERNVSTGLIVASSEPILATVKKDHYIELVGFIVKCTMKFVSECFGYESPQVAATFSKDIIDQYPTWKVDDIVNFFKYVRQNQANENLNVMGNKITVIKLLELATVYEDHRAAEFEIHKHNEKINHEPPKELNDYGSQQIKKILKMLDNKNKPIKTNDREEFNDLKHQELVRFMNECQDIDKLLSKEQQRKVQERIDKTR